MSSLHDLLEQQDAEPRGSNINWPIVVGAIFLGLTLVAVLILGIILLDKAANKAVETLNYANESMQSLSQVYDENQEVVDAYGQIVDQYVSGGTLVGPAAAGEGAEEDMAGAMYTPGKVKGTTYTSSFSGITFAAPGNWSVAAGNGTTSAPDLVARNASGTMSVKIQYFELNDDFSSAKDVVGALKAQVEETVTDESVKANVGGNNCKGFIFQGSNGADTAYTEILGCDLNGFAMVIQIIAPKPSDLNTVLDMFS